VSEWLSTNIGAICQKVVSGGTPLTSNHDYYKNGGIPWLKTKEVNQSRIYSTENHITQLGLDNSSAKLIPVNSVVIAMYGDGKTAGRVGLTKIPLATNQACCNLIFDENKTHAEFVFYYLLGSYDELVARKTGSGQQNLNAQLIKAFEIPLPSLSEQKAIASVLSSLDDKIDLLHNQNTTLESMAETLFRQWFVEEAQEDWKELRLDNIASVVSGYNHKQDELSETGDYLLSMGSAIKKYGFSIDASRLIKTGSISEKYLCYANDIFLTTRDVTQNAELLGSPGIIPPCIKQKVVLGSNLYKLQVKNKKLPISIIYFLLRSEFYREYVKEVASGTSILMLKKSDLDSFSFKLPPISTLVRLDELLSNILSKLNSNFEQEITIKKLRDNLLPKLMSGEIKLS
jgi:type I restriction enzyme S subunit